MGEFDDLDDDLPDLPITRPHAATEFDAQAGNLPPVSGTPPGPSFPAPPPVASDPSGMPDSLPDESYQDEISRIDAEPHIVLEWVHDPDLDDWPDPVDLWGGISLPIMSESCLPPAAAPFILDQSGIITADPVQMALNARVIAAACIRVGINVRMQAGATAAPDEAGGRIWMESPILWGSVVADPSSLKGPVLNAATHYFRHISNNLRKKNETAWADYDRLSKIHEKAMQVYYSAAAKDPNIMQPEAPEKPPRERMWTDDVTKETVAKLICENPRGKILIIKDELAGWFGSFDAYGNGKSDKDRPDWLSFYESGERYIDRSTEGKSYHVPSWGGPIIGGIQPSVLSKIASKLGPDGMLQRFMIVLPRDAGDEDESARYDQAAIARWNRILDGLIAMMPRGNPITLKPKAAEFCAEKRRWGKDVQRAAIDPSLKFMLGKWPGLHGRLMITDHCIADADKGLSCPSPEISLDIARTTWDWMEKVLWPHAVQFYMGLRHETEDNTAVMAFADFVLARNLREVKPGYLSGEWSHYRKFKYINQRKEFWDSVVNLGIARPMNDGFNRTGQIARTYEINPKFLDGRFKEQAARARNQAARYKEVMHPAMNQAQERQPGQD